MIGTVMAMEMMVKVTSKQLLDIISCERKRTVIEKYLFFFSESGGDLDEDEDIDSDGGSVSLDGEDDGSGSDIFEDDEEDDDDDEEVIDGGSDEEISDPDEPKAKKSKALSSKEFQRKLKNTDSKYLGNK